MEVGQDSGVSHWLSCFGSEQYSTLHPMHLLRAGVAQYPTFGGRGQLHLDIPPIDSGFFELHAFFELDVGVFEGRCCVYFPLVVFKLDLLAWFHLVSDLSQHPRHSCKRTLGSDEPATRSS